MSAATAFTYVVGGLNAFAAIITSVVALRRWKKRNGNGDIDLET